MFWKTAVLAAAAAGVPGVLAQLTVEKYDSNHLRWPYQPGCDPLKLNISGRGISLSSPSPSAPSATIEG